ncbi:MAG: hydrolase, alpha/beta fold family protein [Actinomycetia bacterium]|nr:hydrolase, alpha/beta fold family protein [Actinomycetes bacterium]
MATFVLLPGAGSDSWHWHLVTPELEARGHVVVAVDLPVDDDSAGLATYADVATAAIGDRTDLVVVAQSMGAFTAGLVCDRLPVELVVLVAGMTPAPGESPGDWWANTGHAWPEDDDPMTLFLHDVPPDVAAESAKHVRNQSGTPFEEPWPLAAWPDVPTRFLLCRHDRLFPADFQRRVVRERLGITPDEMDGGHLPALHSPNELVERLVAYQRESATR